MWNSILGQFDYSIRACSASVVARPLPSMSMVSLPAPWESLRECTCLILSSMRSILWISAVFTSFIMSVLWHTDDHPTRIIYQFNSPFSDWRQTCGRTHSHRTDVIHQDLQQINLALVDVPMLYQDHESWWDKVALASSMCSWHEILQKQCIKLQTSRNDWSFPLKCNVVDIKIYWVNVLYFNNEDIF